MGKNLPVLETHYGVRVWTHKMMDELRRTECLCRNCDRLIFNSTDSCPIALALYGVCKTANVALSVTRCPEFKAKGTRDD